MLVRGENPKESRKGSQTFSKARKWADIRLYERECTYSDSVSSIAATISEISRQA